MKLERCPTCKGQFWKGTRHRCKPEMEARTNIASAPYVCCSECGMNVPVGSIHSCTTPKIPQFGRWEGDDFLQIAREAAEYRAREMEFERSRNSQWERTFREDCFEDASALLDNARANGVDLEITFDPVNMVYKTRLCREEVPPKFFTDQAVTFKSPAQYDPTARNPDKPLKTVDIDWLLAGVAAARESAAFIRLEVEEKGVTVIGSEGDRVVTHTITWEALDKAAINPLIPAVHHVEEKLEN